MATGDGSPGVTRHRTEPHDATDRRRADETALESGTILRALLESASEAVVIVGSDGRVVLFSTKAEEMFGYSRDELLGQTVETLIPGQFRDAHVQHRAHYISHPRVRPMGPNLNLVGRRKDGTEFPVEIGLSFIKTDDGGLAMSLVTDISERKRSEEALRSIVEGTSSATGDEFFRSLACHLSSALNVRYAAVGELVNGAQDRVRILAVWTGEGFGDNFEYDLAGTPCENVVNRTMCHYPRNVQALFPDDHLLAEMGVESYLGIPLFDSSGNALGHLMVLHDEPMDEASTAKSILTIFAARAGAELERKRAEETLRKLSSAVEHAGDGVVITDRDGVLEFVNPTFEQLTGYTKEEVIGNTPRILKSGKHPGSFYEKLWETILSGHVFRAEFINRRKNGELYQEERVIAPMRDNHGKITHFVSTGRDITERKRAEEQLQVARENLEGRVERQLQRRNPYGLTFRELTVLHVVAAGKSGKEIAIELGISPLTVQKHLSNILAKMDASSRTEAVARGLREGLLD